MCVGGGEGLGVGEGGMGGEVGGGGLHNVPTRPVACLLIKGNEGRPNNDGRPNNEGRSSNEGRPRIFCPSSLLLPWFTFSSVYWTDEGSWMSLQ